MLILRSNLRRLLFIFPFDIKRKLTFSVGVIFDKNPPYLLGVDFYFFSYCKSTVKYSIITVIIQIGSV